MHNPLVTICVPVFNAQGSIQTCLDAVLAQDVEGAEILVVDNASDDQTVAVAQRILEGVPGARVVRNETNLGRIENWNRCIELARGDYVKFALVNDVLLKRSVRVLLDEALRNPAAVMVCSKARSVDKLPAVLPAMDPASDRRSLSSEAVLQEFAEQGNTTGALNGMLLKREPILANGLRFREEIPYMADFFFSIQLARHGEMVFVDAASHLFNTGAQSRFAFAGLSTDVLWQERECCLEIAKLLRSYGRDDTPARERLLGIYKYWIYNMEAVGFQETWRLFGGSRAHQLRATGWRVRHALSRAIPSRIAAARAARRPAAT